MRHILSIVLCSTALFLNGQVYQFSEVNNLTSTEVKSQDNTGTCWSYSTTSFLESEVLRLGKGNVDLSEMYNVRMVYPKKAIDYVRYQGKNQFSQGSLAHDVIWSAGTYGLIPEFAYPGKENKDDKHDHSEMEKVLKSILDVVLKESPISTTWSKAFNGVLDAYLGEVPQKFDYENKTYTPKEFASYLGFDASNYVSITSFTHHPFYEDFILEVPDNFSKGSFENVQLDELVKIIDHALDNGYTLAWDGDVSEKGFSSKEGLAILPEKGASKETLFKEVVKEEVTTQKSRQKNFDSQRTTDDHLMHITGKMKDQNGVIYYKVKNSWGSERGHDGYIYMSTEYLKMKTVSVLLHKDGVPKDLAKKLDI